MTKRNTLVIDAESGKAIADIPGQKNADGVQSETSPGHFAIVQSVKTGEGPGPWVSILRRTESICPPRRTGLERMDDGHPSRAHS